MCYGQLRHKTVFENWLLADLREHLAQPLSRSRPKGTFLFSEDFEPDSRSLSEEEDEETEPKPTIVVISLLVNHARG